MKHRFPPFVLKVARASSSLFGILKKPSLDCLATLRLVTVAVSVVTHSQLNLLAVTKSGIFLDAGHDVDFRQIMNEFKSSEAASKEMFC